MADLNEVYDALRKADAAGDADAVKRLSDFLIESRNDSNSNVAMSHMPRPNVAPLPDYVQDMSGLDRVRAGWGKQIADVGRWTGNKVGLVSDENVAEADKRDAPLMRTAGATAGHFVGGIANTAPIGMGVSSAVSTLGRGGMALASNPISRGAIEGAVQGGINSRPGDTGKAALLGALGGAAIPSATALGKKMMTGTNMTPSARDLINRGVDLTPGQMNPSGMVNQLESTWQSFPVIGPLLSGARKNAENQYKQQLIQEAAAPGAKLTATKDMNAMLDEAYHSFGPAYDTVKGFPLVLQKGKPVIVNKGANVPLSDAFASVVRDKGVLASDDTRRMVQGYLDNQLTKPIKESGDLLSMRSQLRSKIRAVKGTSQDDLAQKELLSNAEDSVTHALESQLPPNLMNHLKSIDSQYGKYKIVENAVAKGGDKEFTTFQASQAVRQATDKGEYARGGGRMRDLTAAGSEVFADTPQTGARLAAIGIPAAAIMAKPMIGVPAALGLAGLSLTKPGRNFAAGDTALQKAIQKAVQKTAPAINNQISPEVQKQIAQMLNRGAVQSLDKWAGTRTDASE